MSTPAPAGPSLLRATQQQLDELDALLQRMLALPVIDKTEEPLEGAAPAASTETASDGDEINTPQEQAAPDEELAVAPPLADADGEKKWESIEDPGGQADPEPSLGAETLVLAPPANLAWHWLVPVNWLFDLFTIPLGPAGSWLRGEQGRAFLGYTGLALLLAAVVVGLLDWFVANW